MCYHIQPKVIVFRSIPAGYNYSVLVACQSCPYTLHKPSFRSCGSFLDNLKSTFSIEGPCLTHVRPTCAQERRHMGSHEDVGTDCHRSLCQSPNLIVFKCKHTQRPILFDSLAGNSLKRTPSEQLRGSTGPIATGRH